jgi:hypothetical protein
MTLTPPPDLPRTVTEIRNRLHVLEMRRGGAAQSSDSVEDATVLDLIIASQMYGNLFGLNNWPGGDAPFDPYGSSWGGLYTRSLDTPQDGYGAWWHMWFASPVAGTDSNEIFVESVWGTDPDVDFGYTQMFFALDKPGTSTHKGVVSFITFDSFCNWPGSPFEPTVFLIPSAGWHQEGPSVEEYDDIDIADCQYSVQTDYGGSHPGGDGVHSSITFYHRVRTRNGDPETAEGHTCWIRPLEDQELNAFVFGAHGGGHSGLSPQTSDPEFFFVTGVADAVWPDDATGPVFKDRTTGDFYRLLVDSGGTLSIEAV